jgi:hypothetical protein
MRLLTATPFIKRIRPKSGVYGEFILFEPTVQALQWALRRRGVQLFFPTNGDA